MGHTWTPPYSPFDPINHAILVKHTTTGRVVTSTVAYAWRYRTYQWLPVCHYSWSAQNSFSLSKSRQSINQFVPLNIVTRWTYNDQVPQFECTMRRKCAAREHNMGTGTEETSENDCVVLGLFTSIYHLLLAVFLVHLLNVPISSCHPKWWASIVVWFIPTPNETFENACIRNIGNNKYSAVQIAKANLSLMLYHSAIKDQRDTTATFSY